MQIYRIEFVFRENWSAGQNAHRMCVFFVSNIESLADPF